MINDQALRSNFKITYRNSGRIESEVGWADFEISMGN
jgi:hypothetical protein